MNPPIARDSNDPGPDPGFVDAIRFLYARRIQFAVRFLAFLGIGIVGLLNLYLSSPKVVEGIIGLTFRGIERHEYPTGKKFSVEDFRSPDLLRRALGDAGLQNLVADLEGLAAHVFVTPIVPGDIQARWKKQERDGSRRDEYFPNEFKMAVEVTGLSNAQRLRLFDALVRHYQDRVKYLQKSALSTVAVTISPYEKLATGYDFWDLPSLFLVPYQSLVAELNTLILESLQYPDPKYQLAFRNIANDLNTWYTMRLQALEAATFQGRLVKNREAMMQRIQYRIEQLEVGVRQKAQEAGEQTRLLALIDRPKTVLAGQFGNEKGAPFVDGSALDKLLKSDYVGPLVARISKLQEEKEALEAEKARLQKQLGWLPKANNTDINSLPPGYKDIVQTAASDLREIIQSYNRLLDEYLTATVSSQVAIKQSPVITREGYPSTTILAAIVFLSVFLTIALMSLEHLYRKARDETRAARHSATAT